MTADSPGEAPLSAAQYAAIAGFRHALRRFLSFSEEAALAASLPAQQHQALLAIAGRAQDKPASVGFVAAQLLIAPHTAAELTSRMEEAGLLTKSASPADRRRTELNLTTEAQALLARLSAAHLKELLALEPALLQALEQAASATHGPPDGGSEDRPG